MLPHAALSFIVCLPAFVSGTWSGKLAFDAEGRFTLMQITDLHYGENALGDWLSTALVHKLLQDQMGRKLDVAIVSGDSASGYAWDHKQGWYQRLWNEWTKPFLDLKMPYMYALGNHDPQGDANRTQVMEIDRTHPYSMSQKNPDPKVALASNYVVPIYESADSESVSFYLWAFDSGSDNCLGVHGWGCVQPSQVQWYREKSAEIRKANGGKNIPGLAFFHIPFPEFMGNNGQKKNFTFTGYMQEPISCFSVNTGLYSAMVEEKNIELVSVGHDHHNWMNFTTWDQQMMLLYGKKTGYGGYGPNKGVQRGATVITLEKRNQSVSISTDVLFEDLTFAGGKLPVNQSQAVQTECAGMETSTCHRWHSHFEVQMAKHGKSWYEDADWYQQIVREPFVKMDAAFHAAQRSEAQQQTKQVFVV